MTPVSSSKFIKLLKTLTEEELRSFRVWLNSPWCNSNKNLVTLFDTLKKYYPNYEDRKLTKVYLLQKVLPKGKFSEKRINNMLSEAYLALEKFIIFQNLKAKKKLQKDLLSKEFQHRHLDDWFFKNTDKEVERLEKMEIKEWEDHISLLQLNRRIYHHPNQSSRMKLGGQTIVTMGEQLDLVYLLEKAATINEMIFRKRILNKENHDVESELKKWRIASEGIEHPAIEFYKMRFDYTEENRLEQFLKLKNAVFSRIEELNKKEQMTHYLSLMNDGMRLVKARLLDIRELLPMYKFGLKTKLLLIGNILTHNRFSSIVSISNTAKDFEFTHRFIETYVPFLKSKTQTEAELWAKAHTAYYQNKLEESLEILLSRNFQFSNFQWFTKLMTLQVYFDLYLKNDSYRSVLFDCFESLKKWINEDSIRATTSKNAYLKLIEVSEILASAYGEENFQPEKIKHLLNDASNIQAPEWIERKINLVLKLRK